VGEWSPDGRSLLLAGDDGDSELGFWTVDVSAGQASPVAPVPGADSWQGGWTATGWSRDGRAILYSTMDDGTGRSRLVRRDTGSGEEEELYRDSLVIRRPLALSPDGHQVAFVFMDSVDAEGPAGLAALDLGSGTTRRLVTFDDSLSGWELSLQWTPDGKSLLYSRSEQGGDEWRTKVWRVATGGGDPEYLWAFGEDKWGGWFRLSPDGHQIALTTYTQDTEVWVMENLKEVLQTGGSGEGS
jgi:Tol biopolymer transport system component